MSTCFKTAMPNNKRQFLKQRYGSLNEARLISLRAVYDHPKVSQAARIIVATPGCLPLAIQLRLECGGALLVSRDGSQEPDQSHLAHGNDAVMLHTIYSMAGSPPTLLIDWDPCCRALQDFGNVSLLLLGALFRNRPPARLFVTTLRSCELWPDGRPWDVGALAARAALARHDVAGRPGVRQKTCPPTATVAMGSAKTGPDPRRDFGPFMLLAERHPAIKFQWISDSVAENQWNNVSFRRGDSAEEMARGGICYFLARVSDAPVAMSLLLLGVRVIFVEPFANPVGEAWSPVDGGLLCGALRGRRLQHLTATDLAPYGRTGGDAEAATAYVTSWGARCSVAGLWPDYADGEGGGGGASQTPAERAAARR